MIDNLDDKTLISILGMSLGVIACLIFALILILIFKKRKDKKIEKQKMEEIEGLGKVGKPKVSYNVESIVDFMEFEKIEDNMIIQKNEKFLMVVECQGINYDLMSEMEKASVEQGFITFLNTLRHPVQLYIQTRTVNLEKSVAGYKKKLDEIEKKYNQVEEEYEKLLNSTNRNKDAIDKAKYNLVKQKNLKEYTADIIRDIERQSLNQNILSRRYYVIIPCYKSEIAMGDFDKTEVKNMAFSELYTRARAIINSLFACQVTGKILNSDELLELLYVAYNRDEADLFWVDKIKEAGLDSLYTTAPDVIDKKMKLLDKQIDEKAIQLANKKIGDARRQKEIEYLEKESKMQETINKKAKELIVKHKKYIGKEIAEKAIEKIDETDKKTQKNNAKEKVVQKSKIDEEEADDNEFVQKKSQRGRPRKK